MVDSLAEMAGQAGAGFAERLLGLYRENAPVALHALRTAGTAEEVARAAHGLRSMSLNIGGRALARILGEIEEAARTGGEVPPPATIESLAPLVARTVSEVGTRLGLEFGLAPGAAPDEAAPGKQRCAI